MQFLWNNCKKNVGPDCFVFIQCIDKEFEPYVSKIEQLDTSLGELESSVMLLDEYTKRLGEIIEGLTL